MIILMSIVKDYFVLSESRYGKNLIMFCKTLDGVYAYNHDKVYDAHIKHLKTLDCWGKYKRYTKTFGIPHPFCLDCTLISKT